MTRDSASGWAWLYMLRDQLPSFWRWGLLPLLLIGLFILGRSWFVATFPVNDQWRSTWRFAVGQHHIAQQQQRLQNAVATAIRSAGLVANYYAYDRIRSQHRGQESWTLWRHRITVPAERALAESEAQLRTILQQFPHVVLARRVRHQDLTTTVVLTTGMGGESTDIFVLTQPRESPAKPTRPQPLAAPIPPPALPERARVAIVIDDIGWDLSMAQALLALDAPISFAIIPQSPHQAEIVEAAQQYGRDILLHLPMEPHGYPQVNPGKHALLSTMSPPELTAQIQAALQHLPMAVGVNNHMGSRLTENPQAMRVVMQELQQHNLFFLDSRTSSQSTAYKIAREMGVRTGRRQVFLDHHAQPQQIAHQFQRLIAIAHKHGHAIGIGHPYTETLDALQHLLPELREAGIAIVPVSHLIR